MRNQQESRKPPKVWLLFSGGLDSTACLSFYLKQGFDVEPVFVDIGQPAAKNETIAVSKICRFWSLKLTRLTLPFEKPFDTGNIVGRNAFLVFALLMHIGTDSGVIGLGIHSGTQYYDCSTTFVGSLQEIVNGYCDGKVIVSAPFLKANKLDIWRYCLENACPIELTYSCESSQTTPCQKCDSCLDRIAVNDANAL